jgi:hypothetical protein
VFKIKVGSFFEVQVKSVRINKTTYVFMTKEKFDKNKENMLLMLLTFQENALPSTYLIPATEWISPNALLRDREYKGKKSKPEYGINISKRNMVILDKYKFEDVIASMLLLRYSLLKKPMLI